MRRQSFLFRFFFWMCFRLASFIKFLVHIFSPNLLVSLVFFYLLEWCFCLDFSHFSLFLLCSLFFNYLCSWSLRTYCKNIWCFFQLIKPLEDWGLPCILLAFEELICLPKWSNASKNLIFIVCIYNLEDWKLNGEAYYILCVIMR